ncbi:MAG: hypothetical protein M3Z64_03525 [Verrucomicrobiota bacterium]|nr:hypothetical protein [Verrucomicrobiota bacterium]
MKNLAAIFAVAVVSLAAMAASLFAQDFHDEFPSGDSGRSSRSNPFDAMPDRSTRMRTDIDNLNQMFTHVEGEMRTSHANPKVRADYARLVAQRSDLNKALRQRGATDPFRVGEQVKQMRSGLHRIEQDLRVPPGGQYRWH